MAIGVDFILKASTDGFTAGISTANNALKDIKSELKQFGGGQLAQVIGIAGLIRGFQQTLDVAQKNREELEKLGKPIDDATRSVAAYADAWDGIRGTIGKVATTTLSFFTRAGEGIGGVINLMRGISVEQQKISESSAKAAEEQDKQLAKSREENSPDKMKAAEEKLAATRRKNYEDTLAGQEKINALMDDYTAKWEEANKLPKETVKYKEAQVELENQLAAIQKLQTAENAKAVDTGLATIETTQRVVELRVKELEVSTDVTDGQLERLQAERDITAEMQKQADIAEQSRRSFSGSGGPLGGGSDFGSASNDALQEIVSQEREAIRKLRSQPGDLSVDYSIGQRQSRLGAAQAELDFRTNFRRNLDVFGESGARRMFQGDPLAFDSILQQFAKGNGSLEDSKKTAVAITDIRDLLTSKLGKR